MTVDAPYRRACASRPQPRELGRDSSEGSRATSRSSSPLPVLRDVLARASGAPVVASLLALTLGLLGCALSPQQIFERSAPSVVRIEARRPGGEVIGTGFAIDERRIATNLHVIDGSLEAFVQLADGSRFLVRRVLAFDELQDLAILETGASGLRPLRFGDSDDLVQGERIYAIGNPLGLDYTITEGLFSGRRRFGDQLDVELLQVSAGLSEGSSGGPLLNERGEVIGIATRVIRAGGYGLGIPVGALARLVASEARPLAFDEFAEVRMRRLEQLAAARGIRPRERAIPNHPPEFLGGCSRGEVEDVRMAILAAIQRGAPTYNEGDHEGCYRIYEGTALRIARDLSDVCSEGKRALEVGLERADTMESFDDKAWALRDAFDGLLIAIERRYPLDPSGASGAPF